MREKVSIQKIGDGYGIILPVTYLNRVGWKEGDMLELRSDAERIEVTRPRTRARPDDNSLIAGATMRNYYAALKQLAGI